MHFDFNVIDAKIVINYLISMEFMDTSKFNLLCEMRRVSESFNDNLEISMFVYDAHCPKINS